jgi:hypothetical protein
MFHDPTRNARFTLVVLLASLAAFSPDSSVAEDFVAGVEPSRRPAGAPVQTATVKDAAWYSQALTGVSRPYPASLRFLENQGAWYTPFNRPGMTGSYDLRNWHGSASSGAGRSVPGR